ncbi:MAG: hypothetical protein AAGD23_05370 [Pseudomonadota bacterium]
MNASAPTISEKVGEYLGTLPETLLIRLVHEIRGAALLGDEDPANAMIADAAAAVLASRHPDGGDALCPDTTLFHPIMPFLVSTSGNTKYQGRIRRKSIEGLWVYFNRDRPLDGLGALVRKVATDILGTDGSTSTSSVADVVSLVLPELQLIQQGTAKGEANHARMVGQIGGKGVAEDVAEVTRIFQVHGVLANLSKRLPTDVEVLGTDHLSAIAQAISALQPVDYALLAILLNSRLAHPASMLRILIDKERTDDASVLAKSKLAVLVDVLMDELAISTDLVAERVNSNAQNDDVIHCLRRFHDVAAGLTTEISIEMHGAWFQRLAQERRRMADVAAREIEQIPGRLRLAIQPGGGSLMPDPKDIEIATSAARLLIAAKPLRSGLALNETLGRVNTQAESLVDAAARSLPEQARAASGDQLAILGAQFTGLSCVAKELFGKEYARLLLRSGQVAGLHQQAHLMPKAA